jgi:Tat protein secretion system quality control protein TatD with DNase activity
MFVDSHCHLDFPEYAGQIPDILARMKEAQVSHAMCISVDMPDFPNVLALAESHPNLFATVGTHPDYSGKGIARALSIASINYFVNKGLKHSILYVDADNEKGLKLYSSLGFN